MTANKTWVCTYDRRGNILSRKTYAYTTGTLGTVQDTDTYEYYSQSSTTAWGDMLMRYDQTNYISYDAIGNPLYYVNGPDQGYAYVFSWQNGRQLASGTKGTTEFAYTYNADGLRTKKVVNGVTTEYYWAGSQLAMMIVNPDLPTKKVLKFYYDAEGRPMCLDFNGTVYLYITNLQGDVVALADQYGEVIRYEYDAWGKPISTYYVATPYHDAMYYNPLRYRGYIYDNETGFYYLQSRYYDPVVGRFINSDGQLNGGFLGNNMFAYCENNPVMYVDYNGCELALGITLTAGSEILVLALVVIAAVCVLDNADEISQGVTDIYCGIVEAAETITEALTDALTDTKVKEEEKVEEKTSSSPSSTVIYRYGGGAPSNLTPSKYDVRMYEITGKGLSFSTVPKPGAVKTTIEELNATGVVYAVQDGENHVSVFPVGATLEEWHKAGSSSEWTKAVKSVVSK